MPFEPIEVAIVIETPDELRHFYHLMNFQNKEIEKGYDASSLGPFHERFRVFEPMNKKPLFKDIKALMKERGIQP